jgi:hypothetical protein
MIRDVERLLLAILLPRRPMPLRGRCSSRLRPFDLSGLDERSIGALMMHFIIETILAAILAGVNLFD